MCYLLGSSLLQYLNYFRLSEDLYPEFLQRLWPELLSFSQNISLFLVGLKKNMLMLTKIEKIFRMIRELSIIEKLLDD